MVGDIELPGFLAKFGNLIGLNWTNAKASGASGSGSAYLSYATKVGPAVQTAQAHAPQATAAARGTAGTAMTTTLTHDKGALANSVDHHTGVLLMALITGGALPLIINGLKMAKITDGAVAVDDLVAEEVVPGGQVAIPATLEASRLQQTFLTNVGFEAVMGGGVSL
jgi:hypothetical protein